MLNADEFVFEVLHLPPGMFEQFVDARRKIWLAPAKDMRHALKVGVDHTLRCCQAASHIPPYLLDDLLDNAPFLRQ